MTDAKTTEGRKASTYNTYKKFAIQWLNKALYFISSSVVADRFYLRNRQLLVATKRYALCLGDIANLKLTAIINFNRIFNLLFIDSRYQKGFSNYISNNGKTTRLNGFIVNQGMRF